MLSKRELWACCYVQSANVNADGERITGRKREMVSTKLIQSNDPRRERDKKKRKPLFKRSKLL